MPSILALDQGTTGSTALVIHQDGSVLGRAYREWGVKKNWCGGDFSAFHQVDQIDY